MKHIFITGSLLFAFATSFAQVKLDKNPQVPVNVNTVTESQKPQNQLEKETPVKNRGQRPQSQLEKETPVKNRGQRPQSQLEKEIPVKNRSQNNQNRPEVIIKQKSRPTSLERPVDGDDAYCVGWEDGYIKAWNAGKAEFEKPIVPPCREITTCEGYKCGYVAGMKQAQKDLR